MKKTEFEIEGKKVVGIEIALPGAPLVLAYGKSGFVMCGYLNVETAEKLGVPAAMVRGVSTVDDLLKAKIVAVSRPGLEKGIAVGMTGKQALLLLP